MPPPEEATPPATPWYFSPALWFVLATAATTIWVSWSAFEYPLSAFRFGSDYWEHSATIAEWQRDLWSPGNPHLPIETGTPRYMPFFFVLTVVSNWFELDPIQAMAVGATVNMVLFSAGIWLFFRHYFRSDWAPVIGFVVLTCGWGLSWIFSNLFQLRGLFFVASYPSMLVFALCFFAWWQTARLLRGEAASVLQYAALALITALMLISHPLTGAFGLGTMILMALLEPGAAWKARGRILAALLLGSLLTEAWPYFSTWEVVTGTSGGSETSWVEDGQVGSTIREAVLTHGFYTPREVIISLGFTLLGLPALVLLLLNGRHLFIVAGFAGTIAIYALNLFFPIPLGHRFLLFAAVFMQLALVWWILRAGPAWQAFVLQRRQTGQPRQRAPVFLTGALLVSMVLWNVSIAAMQFGGFQAVPDGRIFERYSYLQPVLQDIRIIADQLPDDAVVIGHPWRLWPLPTFKGKVVSLYHANPMVADDRKRSSDVASFLEAETSQEERREIMKRYGVTYILYNLEPQKEIVDQLNALGEVVFRHKGYVLVEVSNPE
jgi:hypothetical protein